MCTHCVHSVCGCVCPPLLCVGSCWPSESFPVWSSEFPSSSSPTFCKDKFKILVSARCEHCLFSGFHESNVFSVKLERSGPLNAALRRHFQPASLNNLNNNLNNNNSSKSNEILLTQLWQWETLEEQKWWLSENMKSNVFVSDQSDVLPVLFVAVVSQVTEHQIWAKRSINDMNQHTAGWSASVHTEKERAGRDTLVQTHNYRDRKSEQI